MKKTFFLKIFIFLSVSSLFLARANTSPQECVELFSSRSFDMEQANLARVQKTVEIIYPVLLAQKSAPSSVIQYAVQKTAEVLSKISQFNQDMRVIDQGFQNSDSFRLTAANQKTVKSFDEVSQAISRDKKIFELKFLSRQNLDNLVIEIPKKISELTALRQQVESENNSLNEQYSEVREKLDALNVEIDFINKLIERFHSDVSSHREIAPIANDLQVEAMPSLIQLSGDLFTLKMIIEKSLESMNIRIKANNLSLDQARKVIDVAYPLLLENHPKIKSYLNTTAVDAENNISTEFKLKEGDGVYTKDGRRSILSILPDGNIVLEHMKKFSPNFLFATRVLRQDYRDSEVASTNRNLVSKGFRVGDTIRSNKIKQATVVGLYKDGSLMVEMAGTKKLKVIKPEQATLLKKRDGSPQENDQVIKDNVAETFKLNVGDVVCTDDGISRISRLERTGQFVIPYHLTTGFPDKDYFYRPELIASTDLNLVSRGFRVKDLVQVKKLNEGYVAGIFQNGKLAILRNGNSKYEFFDPSDVTLIKSREAVASEKQ